MTEQRISRAIMLRFGLGQMGAQIVRDTPAVLLPIFMTTMLGVPAWLAGATILGPKIWLIFCDPMMGALSDKTKPRYGRTPFLAAGAILTSLGFLALFSITAYPTPLVAAAFICGIFFLTSTAFSMFSVPYLAVASELSHDPHERTKILAYRIVFATLGVVIGVGTAQPLIQHFGGHAEGWRVMAVIFALLCFASMAATALGLRKVQLIEGAAAAPPILAQFSSVAANRPYLVLLATCFVQGIGQACAYTVLGFIYVYVLRDIDFIPAFILVMSAGSLVAQPMWLALSRRFGKARCYVLASLSWTAITATWIFLRPGTDVLLTLPLYGPLSTQAALVLVRSFFLGVLNAGFLLLALSMLTDTIDLERQRTGQAHEGMFSGLFAAGEKLAFAVGPLIAGGVLSVYGFVSSNGGPAPQSPHAIAGIVLLYSLIPAALQIAGLLIFSQYGRATARRRAIHAVVAG